MTLRLLCLGLLLLSGTSLAALPGAEPYHYHAREWSTEQGLPSAAVTALVQGKQGFIWAGTQVGLARFDGTHFKVFNSVNTPLLGGTSITALAVDDGGRLWIGTSNGLAVHINGHFEKLPQASTALGQVNALAVSKGGVWIAASRGLFRIDKNQLQPRAVAGWTAQGARSVTTGPGGSLWVAAKGGVYGRLATGTAFRFYPLPDPTLFVYALTWFAGHLWVGTNHGLYTMRDSQLVATEPLLAKRSIRALLGSPSRYLWIGTDASLFRLDNRNRLVDFSRTPGLQGKWIWSLGMDRAGDPWIGTATNGMIRLWNNHITWFGRSAGLVDDVTTAVYRDRDGSILIGGRSGGYRYRDGRFHQFLHPADLPNSLVRSFLRRENGQLWIGTMGGLAIMQSGRIMALPKALAPLAQADIYNLRQDPDDTLWIATTRGLFRYRDGQLRRFGKQDGLDDEFVRGTYRVENGALWAGTDRGVFEYSQGRFHKLCEAGHLDGRVLDVARGANGVTWIAAADGVLFRYAAGQCKPYVFNVAPLSGSLYYVIPDGHGKLWLINDNGIYRVAISHLVDYTSGHARRAPERVVERADSLHQIHPGGGNPQTALLDPDGNLWVLNINGVVVINLDQPPAIATTAPVIIESITRGSHTSSVTRLPASVTFPPGRTDLRIEYASLDFRTPESMRYQYRLSGYDAAWVDAGTRQEALYTHLPPGHYRFEVRAGIPGGGAANGQAAMLDLTLKPFFYQTWWFRALLGMLAAYLVYAAYALRVRHIRARQGQLEMLIATRTEELKEANRQLQQASVTDPLTSLKNRRYFVEAIQTDIATMHRDPSVHFRDKGMVFFMLDLDDFKAVNDTFGHQAGDAVLTQLGDLLVRTARVSDSVIRWGGEEFLVVARRVDRPHAAMLAENLRARIADHAFKLNGTATISCTCSIGFCPFPLVPGEYAHPTWEGVVNLADAALYEAKRRGKNMWVGVMPTTMACQANLRKLQSPLDVLLEEGLVTLEEMVRTSQMTCTRLSPRKRDPAPSRE